jgi:lysophospholipase L1-like esterase
MNTNPNAKTILCYGDSNTWGAHPQTRERLTADKRWTGVAQKILGFDYYIIEEGLCGRTTIYNDPVSPWKNGITYLLPCLGSHTPLDLVIILLGTNDIKTTYSVSRDEIGKGIEELIKLIISLKSGRNGRDSKILIIAPPLIKQVAKHADERMVEAPEKSERFSKAYQQIADKYHCYYLDASTIIESSDFEGYHLDEDAHKKLGEAVAKTTKSILE